MEDSKELVALILPIPGTILQLWKSSHSWQQMMLALCWCQPDSNVGLLRAFPVLVADDTTSGALDDSLWLASRLVEEPGKPLYMLEHVVDVNAKAKEVHLINTGEKKLSAPQPNEVMPTTGKFLAKECASLLHPVTHCYALQYDRGQAYQLT